MNVRTFTLSTAFLAVLAAPTVAADKIDINGTTVRTLCAADQILHICEHGARMNETAPFRWLADVCLILRRGGIDWQRLGTLAERFELIEPVSGSRVGRV